MRLEIAKGPKEIKGEREGERGARGEGRQQEIDIIIERENREEAPERKKEEKTEERESRGKRVRKERGRSARHLPINGIGVARKVQR